MWTVTVLPSERTFGGPEASSGVGVTEFVGVYV